jgi:hypothetical protein
MFKIKLKGDFGMGKRQMGEDVRVRPGWKKGWDWVPLWERKYSSTGKAGEVHLHHTPIISHFVSFLNASLFFVLLALPTKI